MPIDYSYYFGSVIPITCEDTLEGKTATALGIKITPASELDTSGAEAAAQEIANSKIGKPALLSSFLPEDHHLARKIQLACREYEGLGLDVLAHPLPFSGGDSLPEEVLWARILMDMSLPYDSYFWAVSAGQTPGHSTAFVDSLSQAFGEMGILRDIFVSPSLKALCVEKNGENFGEALKKYMSEVPIIEVGE